MASTSSGLISTRSKTVVWLIGQISPVLAETKLPSTKEVLQLFFFYKFQKKLNNNAAADSTTQDLIVLWEKASIPTRKKQHVKQIILIHFKQWQCLKKNKENKTKRSEAIQRKENTWQTQLEELFAF